MSIWAIIPVKPLRRGKSRLAHVLTTDQRARLTSRLLRQTLKVLNNVPEIRRSLVISRDPAALKLAHNLGAATFAEGRKQDMNVAITRAAHVAAARHADWLLILPSDLPYINVADIRRMLPSLATPDDGQPYPSAAMNICSDHHSDGTNALLIGPPLGFRFAYGPGSFQRHQREGRRLGLPVAVVDAPGLRFDLDTEADWRLYQAQGTLTVSALDSS